MHCQLSLDEQVCLKIRSIEFGDLKDRIMLEIYKYVVSKLIMILKKYSEIRKVSSRDKDSTRKL